jgi:hypothetical protein
MLGKKGEDMVLGEVENAMVRVTIEVTRHESVENIAPICLTRIVTRIKTRGTPALTFAITIH